MGELHRKNKLVYGVGVNDADYVVRPMGPDGKQVRCRLYEVWQNMLGRAYDPKWLTTHPTYKGTTVCEEWHSFVSFKTWAEEQDWEGKQLDKDLIAPGNKHYSPETCAFVSSSLNQLLTDRGAARGAHPIGVSFHKLSGKYRAQVGENGTKRHLGLFDTPEAANAAWRKEKSRIVRAAGWAVTDHPKLRAGLFQHSYLIEYGNAT
jgi:hypothetical protein